MSIQLNLKNLVTVLSLLLPAWAAAQLSIPSSVFGNGGTPASNAQWTIKSTVAQPLIGPSSGAASQQLLGFWYQPNALLTRVEQVNPDELTDAYHLGQNFPNPAKTYTTIPFSVPRESFVELVLMNNSGKVISRLTSGNLFSGQYQAGAEVSSLPAGIYLYQLYVDKQLAGSRKMVVVR